MKTKIQTPSVVSNNTSAALVSGLTLGLDLGDRQPWWWPVVLLVLCGVSGTLLILLYISLGKDKLGLSFAGSICNPKNTGWPPADAVTNFSKPLKMKD